MNIHIALPRAINVGGTGKLKMAELRWLCEEVGFANVQTYIASGNVVFRSKEEPNTVKQKLEKKLCSHMGYRVPVVARTGAELRETLEGTPVQACTTE